MDKKYITIHNTHILHLWHDVRYNPKSDISGRILIINENLRYVALRIKAPAGITKTDYDFPVPAYCTYINSAVSLFGKSPAQRITCCFFHTEGRQHTDTWTDTVIQTDFSYGFRKNYCLPLYFQKWAGGRKSAHIPFQSLKHHELERRKF